MLEHKTIWRLVISAQKPGEALVSAAGFRHFFCIFPNSLVPECSWFLLI